MSDQRRRILEQACELYLTDGLDGFSMRKLAKALGVTAPSLYRHYESREKVLLAVVGEAYKEWSHYLYRSLSGATPLERLFRAGMENLDFALENPRFYHMLYVTPDVLGVDEFPPDLSAQCSAIGQFWNDRVRECMDEGYLKPGRPEDVGMTMWAHAHGLITIYLQGILDLSEGEFRVVYKESSRRVMNGLGTARLVAVLEEEAVATG